MASDSERPDIAAFEELQQLVKHLGDELATFRRRAQTAEARVKAIDSSPGGAKMNPERVDRLEKETPTSSDGSKLLAPGPGRYWIA